MRFSGVLLAVRDVERSKRFYKELFGQQVALDFGENVTFSGGFSIQEGFSALAGLPEESVLQKPHNMELYFETEDFNGFVKRLKQYPDVQYVHPPKQHSWQQWVVRIYDPDFHMIEIGEDMAAVARRVVAQGHSPEEAARITQHPLAFVLAAMKQKGK
ncbi:MAG: VOC family protein [Oscillospiraceae bacterium]|nr:VOC family protein [Oscillospiraceae bacterium]